MCQRDDQYQWFEPCDLCEAKDKALCMAREKGGDSWIFSVQYKYCTDEGAPSFRSNQDWVLDAEAEIINITEETVELASKEVYVG